MIHGTQLYDNPRLLYSHPLPPIQAKLPIMSSLPLFMSSCCRRFAAIVTPSSRLLPLPLTLPFLPSLVCTAAVADIAAVLLLLLLPSSRLAASAKPSQVRASAVSAAVSVALLLPPSYHRSILRRRRRCHLVADIASRSSLHFRHRYRCRLFASVDSF